jgi:hypothetical protein
MFSSQIATYEQLMREVFDVFLLRKALQKSFSTGWSDFSTHLFKPLKTPLKGEISVHIAIRKSTSKNLRDFLKNLTTCSM